MSRSDLFAGIIGTPDDDTPRAVYADWLQEQGDPRGGFIQAQLAMANAAPISKGYFDALAVAAPILHEHGEAWTSEFKSLRKATFRRGFVQYARVLSSQFVKQEGALLEQTPVERVRFQRLQGKAEALARLPALRRLRGLDLAGLSVGLSDYDALFSSRHLTSLETVMVADMGYATSALTALMNGPANASLTELQLGQARALAGIPVTELPALQRLHVGVANTVAEVHLDGLASLRLPALKELTLNAGVQPGELTSLEGIPFDQLDAITLRGRPSLPAFLKRNSFASASRVTFEPYWVDPPELLEAVEAGALATCRELTVSGRWLSAIWFEALPRLEVLRVTSASTDELGVLKELPASVALELEVEINAESDLRFLRPVARQLRSLKVTVEAISEASREVLLSTTFHELAMLQISSARDVLPPERTARSLNDARFPQLISLWLQGVMSRTSEAKTLCKHVRLPELRSLSYQARVTAAVIASLKKQLPRLAVLGWLVSEHGQLTVDEATRVVGK